jgi:PPOX class probable FMN-dependent enzyme
MSKSDDARTVPVESVEELRALLGSVGQRSLDKNRAQLHEIDRAWLAASPFCLVATADAEGRCDVSPKGDPPGFAKIIDDRTLAIPERPGNRRADGFQNILTNPHAGLIFFVPGRKDTLRINGRARIVRDAPFFDDMAVKAHRPVLALILDIEEIFFHCAKAFMRSALWDAESWHPEVLPSHAEIVKAVQETDLSLEELEAHYGPNYEKKLYG